MDSNFYLRCYVIRSELRSHQVSLINFGKAKVTQLHRCILWTDQSECDHVFLWYPVKTEELILHESVAYRL